ncbi:hypothetical protein AAA088_11040, partial [Hominifimenecus microfluidus]|uniref:hypothetical protein n=1 Tax=Hominifimenecus microfluidus TaxID=2885348 RepID=UPI0032BF522D
SAFSRRITSEKQFSLSSDAGSKEKHRENDVFSVSRSFGLQIPESVHRVRAEDIHKKLVSE